MADGSAVKPRKRYAPTLWAIILIKLGKGALLLLLALGVYTLSNDTLPHQFQHLLEFLRIDPERQFFLDAAAKLEHITESNVKWVAAGTAIYSLFSLVEAVAGVGFVPCQIEDEGEQRRGVFVAEPFQFLFGRHVFAGRTHQSPILV